MEKLLSACVQETERALRICQSADGPYMYAPVLEKEKERFEQCAGLDTLAQYGAALAEIAFARLPSKRDESVSAQKREQVKGIRAQIKEALEKAKKRYFFESQETMIRDMQESGALAGTLAELTLEFGRRFAEKKREKNILDFADLEHFALRILLKETPEGQYEPSGAAAERPRGRTKKTDAPHGASPLTSAPPPSPCRRGHPRTAGFWRSGRG